MTYIRWTNELIDVNLAKNHRNVKRLSDYKNANIMEWKCTVEDCGYVWKSRWNDVRRLNNGCLRCSGKEPWTNELIDANLVGHQRNINRRSQYKSNHRLMQWQCTVETCGYSWSAAWSSINQGTGCPRCHKKERWTNDRIDDELSKNHRNISRLSDYKNNHRIVEWLCLVCGEKWNTSWTIIQQGHGCPYCSRYINENICRKFMECIFNDKFIKCSPEWLDGLEFDGYSERMKIAFECNGKQHYAYNQYFYKNDLENFKKRLLFDADKLKKSDENGVILIIIPYWIENKDKERFIIEQYKEKTGIEINYCGFEWKEFSTFKENELKKIIDFARDIGYECLSHQYFTSLIKLDFKCNQGHFFSVTPSNFINGRKCPICHELNRSSIIRKSLPKTSEQYLQECKDLAESIGFKCLSKQYFTSQTKLDFECDHGHRFQMTQNNFKKGNRCPICYNLNRGRTKHDAYMKQKELTSLEKFLKK